MKTLFYVNHKKLSNGFLFQAFFCAILFAVIFLVNDILDEVIDKDIHGKYQKWYKLLIHTMVVFVFTLVVMCFLFVIFGWGRITTEP